ncbi:acyltransferase family protein [Aureisphaera galaxeae]|uniref:acyltransferase family protein n=1 Tax=Aureisphaera galaxeae TaxID=1538023 RepID=UPI002350DB1E|nr:acyltransferase family protein [Aureisphaera galaxeae]MDC8004295.1 acyltransferase family protein [Aureisphaera galaxeae]
MQKTIRRHDLDWLRVLVFGLLILYHVGMFFVPWDWHIKNNIIYDWLRWPMIFLNQWRLPILFVISGMGTYFALSKRNLGQFNLERYLRLGVPLLFGMLIIVPPQVYFERLTTGEFVGSYWEYYTTASFAGGPYPEGNITWHHLWFLPYLFLFSLVLSPLFIYLKRNKTRFVEWIKKVISKPFGFYIFIIPLFLVEVFVEPFFPTTHALIGDWFTISFYIILFFYGFVLIATGNVFWESLERIKKKALILGIISFTLLILRWLFIEADDWPQHLGEGALKIINLWSWILVLFGYAAQYLNKPSRQLSYANRAVYPFYILHQTITIALGFYLMNLEWNFFIKAGLMTLGTFLISWMIYDLIILRIPLLHPVFGLKKQKKTPPNS